MSEPNITGSVELAAMSILAGTRETAGRIYKGVAGWLVDLDSMESPICISNEVIEEARQDADRLCIKLGLSPRWENDTHAVLMKPATLAPFCPHPNAGTGWHDFTLEWSLRSGKHTGTFRTKMRGNGSVSYSFREEWLEDDESFIFEATRGLFKDADSVVKVEENEEHGPWVYMVLTDPEGNSIFIEDDFGYYVVGVRVVEYAERD